MAIYHVHCEIIGRSRGRSATAAAAYRATCKITDRTTGETFDFSRKHKCLYSGIIVSDTSGLPPLMDIIAHTKSQDLRSELWNSVEERENRKNSQFCRSFDIALPKELSLDDNIKLVKRWANSCWVSRGLIADITIHAGHKENGNIHAHVLVPTRTISRNGWGKKDREGNSRVYLKHVRKEWATLTNLMLEERKINQRIDERTLEAQGIDRIPQKHQGVIATAMERKGIVPDRKRQEEEPPVMVTKEEVNAILQNHLDDILQMEREKFGNPTHKKDKSRGWGR